MHKHNYILSITMDRFFPILGTGKVEAIFECECGSKLSSGEISKIIEAAQQVEQTLALDGLCRECGIVLCESDVDAGECIEHQYARQ